MASKIQEGSRLDLQIVQGATFEERFNWQDSRGTPVDLAGKTARLQIKYEESSDSTFIELTTENSRIFLNSPNPGDILLTISSVDTSALAFNTAVYDLEIVSVNGGETTVDNILWGSVSLRRNVTR